MYDQVITVCNKLKKADTVSKISDEWVKTVVYNAEHRTQVNKTVVGSVVNMGQSQTVLIPFVGNNHLPYIDWAKSPQSGFTMSQGDI